MKELLQSAQALHIRGYTAASTKEVLPSLLPPKAFPPPGAISASEARAISASEAPSPAATFASEVPHRTCSYLGSRCVYSVNLLKRRVKRMHTAVDAHLIKYQRASPHAFRFPQSPPLHHERWIVDIPCQARHHASLAYGTVPSKTSQAYLTDTWA